MYVVSLCVCVCVGFRAIMGICECWVQVIDAGTLETGRQSDWPCASLKRGKERKGEEEKIREEEIEATEIPWQPSDRVRNALKGW